MNAIDILARYGYNNTCLNWVMQDFNTIAKHAVQQLQLQIGDAAPAADITVQPIIVTGGSVSVYRRGV